MKWDNIKSLIWSRRMLDAIFLAVALALGIYLQWPWTDVAVFCVFVWMIIHPFSSKYPALAALILLALTPFFIIIDQKAVAEELAVNAYYFLVMAVIMGVYELRNDKGQMSNDKE